MIVRGKEPSWEDRSGYSILASWLVTRASYRRPLSSTHRISTITNCPSAPNAFYRQGITHVAELARFWASYVDKHLPTIPFNDFNHCWRYSHGPVCNQHAPRRSPSRNIRLLRGRIPEEIQEICVAYTGVRLSKMAKHRICVAASLGCANILLGEDTRGGEFGFVATLPYSLDGHILRRIGRG